MKILFEVNHPAHVHFFKNIIWNLENKGHEILIEARDKDVTLSLLEAYKLNYKLVGPHYKNIIRKAYGLVKTDCKLSKIARIFKPDLLVGRGSPYLAHLRLLINKPYIAFVDTEHASLVARLALPFTDVIITPSCFRKKINPKKHLIIDGYKELAYLHPNYFKPDPGVLDDLGLTEEDRFTILRFVAWKASHDVGQYGISPVMRIEYVSKLEKYGKVFIVAEGKLKKEFEKYKLRIAPEKFHSLLNYAQLYIGEGGSTATEAAILGIPSVFVSSLAGTMGNFEELEKKYGLMYSFSDPKTALKKALQLLEDTNLKLKWQKKKKKLLSEKIDVTKFITEFIEKYPESFYEYREKTVIR